MGGSQGVADWVGSFAPTIDGLWSGCEYHPSAPAVGAFYYLCTGNYSLASLGKPLPINIMVEDELLGYDDTASVAFIRNYIPQELKELLSDDDIVYFVDLIYDYYESRGYLSDDDADDEEPIEIDEDELVDYVVRNAQKDGVGKFDPDQIRFVVQGELEYCESINLFD